MKIAVIGYSGSGKSTLAKHLGAFYGIPVLHLDTVQFEPGWEERDRQEAREMVWEFMSRSSWVIDGNYGGFYQKERMEQADHIVFLEFGRFRCLWRAFRRFLKYRGNTREDMAAGCVEKMDAEFVRWILLEGRTKERQGQFQAIAESYPDKLRLLKNQKQLDALILHPFDEKHTNGNSA